MGVQLSVSFSDLDKLMSTTRLSYRILLLAIAAVPANLQSATLFESNDTLSVTIEAPMRQLLRQRRSDREYDAVLSFADASGVGRRLNFRLATRGRSRLEACDFPPLRLIFDSDESRATVFENQHRLKMVTQCKRGNRGRDWVLQEFGIYRAYNAITDYSYRVRRLEVAFRDTESTRWQRVQHAFLIEPTSEAARRLQRESIRPPRVRPEQFSAVETPRNMLFQYLIGNTDFAVKRGPSGEGCCHNGRVLAAPGRNDDWVVLPFDFDQAGVIDTDYALPDAELPIKRVSARLYRGFCWQNTMLPQSIALFNEHRIDITKALLPPGLGKSRSRRALRFIDRFYDIVSDPRKLKREILDKCRGPYSLRDRKTTVSPPDASGSIQRLLFDDDLTLAVTIEGPLHTIMRNRDDTAEFPATFRYSNSDGT